MATSGNDSRIDYIEMNVADIERSKSFYGKVFAWTFTDYGRTYCEFADGRLTGGFTTNGPPTPGGPLVILYADDLAAMQRRVEEAGGRISKQIFDFPGGQRFHSSIRTAMSWGCGRSGSASDLTDGSRETQGTLTETYAQDHQFHLHHA